MQDVEARARASLRERLVARGARHLESDDALFKNVEGVLRRALDESTFDALMLPELLSCDEEVRLETDLRWSSHRPILGKPILFLKRRLLLPLTRWLYEYSLENFRRQERVNQVLFSCLEELAFENAALRRDIDRLTNPPRTR
jgi:hypothetical protein